MRWMPSFLLGLLRGATAAILEACGHKPKGQSPRAEDGRQERDEHCVIDNLDPATLELLSPDP